MLLGFLRANFIIIIVLKVFVQASPRVALVRLDGRRLSSQALPDLIKMEITSTLIPIFGVGPIAQGLEQSAHNRKVPGSNPGGPTKK